MKKTSPSVLILGSGVAGMAAACSLANQGLPVHLVEEQSHLGGKAALWACMATDTCKQCGACLGIEMAEQVGAQSNITIHLNTKINTLKKNNQGVEASLNSGKTITAAKVIMATGFSPFDPAKIPSFHTDTSKNVITTAQLNTRLREENLSDLLDHTQTPKIAFIQCVGSRNRELKKDYCSQVCCKVSLRHAEKLLHEIPDALITLFYMDLQIIGKEIRQTIKELAPQIELVQGVPAEVLNNSDTPSVTMVIEDPATLSRAAREFDLVVLSVGMEPSPSLDETATLLGAIPNGWGFFDTPEAAVSKDIYIAGCAAGPKDILSSRQEGQILGAKVIEDLGFGKIPEMNVAVLGDGPQAVAIAKEVAAQGFPVYCFGAPADARLAEGTTHLTHARILALDGTIGNFSIFHENMNKKENLTCGAIIAAFEPVISQNAGKGKFQTAMDLYAFAQQPPEACPDKTVILLDYFGPEFKSLTRLALTAAMAVKEAEKKTKKKIEKKITIIMNKMLVHNALGQKLYDQARKLGIQFLRYNSPDDIKIQAKENSFYITLKEATLPALMLDLECNSLVLPPNIRPGPDFEDIAKYLGTSLDREGFLQSPNVRHRLTQSPRKGIFFAGTCHDEIDSHDLENEIQDILSTFKTQYLPGQDIGVVINEKKCAKCLTCYRICPHGAIILNEKMRPQIVADACFSCHLCVANCPAYAIESTNFTNYQIADITNKNQPEKGKTHGDKVIIFACERSAVLAAEKISLPENTRLISIPCAYRISSDMVLKTIINGASRVIVSGCHEGNCRSMDGSAEARNQVTAISKMPGIAPGKVIWEPVAANETKKLLHIISKA
jgi:heterodisulfide reductase subunit A-like polyferredoxin/coenzyme F420-reducing hydrogenase delta subunit